MPRLFNDLVSTLDIIPDTTKVDILLHHPGDVVLKGKVRIIARKPCQIKSLTVQLTGIARATRRQSSKTMAAKQVFLNVTQQLSLPKSGHGGSPGGGHGSSHGGSPGGGPGGSPGRSIGGQGTTAPAMAISAASAPAPSRPPSSTLLSRGTGHLSASHSIEQQQQQQSNLLQIGIESNNNHNHSSTGSNSPAEEEEEAAEAEGVSALAVSVSALASASSSSASASASASAPASALSSFSSSTRLPRLAAAVESSLRVAVDQQDQAQQDQAHGQSTSTSQPDGSTIAGTIEAVPETPSAESSPPIATVSSSTTAPLMAVSSSSPPSSLSAALPSPHSVAFTSINTTPGATAILGSGSSSGTPIFSASRSSDLSHLNLSSHNSHQPQQQHQHHQLSNGNWLSQGLNDIEFTLTFPSHVGLPADAAELLMVSPGALAIAGLPSGPFRTPSGAQINYSLSAILVMGNTLVGNKKEISVPIQVQTWHDPLNEYLDQMNHTYHGKRRSRIEFEFRVPKQLDMGRLFTLQFGFQASWRTMQDNLKVKEMEYFLVEEESILFSGSSSHHVNTTIISSILTHDLSADPPPTNTWDHLRSDERLVVPQPETIFSSLQLASPNVLTISHKLRVIFRFDKSLCNERDLQLSFPILFHHSIDEPGAPLDMIRERNLSGILIRGVRGGVYRSGDGYLDQNGNLVSALGSIRRDFLDGDPEYANGEVLPLPMYHERQESLLLMASDEDLVMVNQPLALSAVGVEHSRTQSIPNTDVLDAIPLEEGYYEANNLHLQETRSTEGQHQQELQAVDEDAEADLAFSEAEYALRQRHRRSLPPLVTPLHPSTQPQQHQTMMGVGTMRAISRFSDDRFRPPPYGFPIIRFHHEEILDSEEHRVDRNPLGGMVGSSTTDGPAPHPLTLAHTVGAPTATITSNEMSFANNGVDSSLNNSCTGTGHQRVMHGSNRRRNSRPVSIISLHDHQQLLQMEQLRLQELDEAQQMLAGQPVATSTSTSSSDSSGSNILLNNRRLSQQQLTQQEAVLTISPDESGVVMAWSASNETSGSQSSQSGSPAMIARSGGVGGGSSNHNRHSFHGNTSFSLVTSQASPQWQDFDFGMPSPPYEGYLDEHQHQQIYQAQYEQSLVVPYSPPSPTATTATLVTETTTTGTFISNATIPQTGRAASPSSSTPTSPIASARPQQPINVQPPLQLRNMASLTNNSNINNSILPLLNIPTMNRFTLTTPVPTTLRPVTSTSSGLPSPPLSQSPSSSSPSFHPHVRRSNSSTSVGNDYSTHGYDPNDSRRRGPRVPPRESWGTDSLTAIMTTFGSSSFTA